MAERVAAKGKSNLYPFSVALWGIGLTFLDFHFVFFLHILWVLCVFYLDFIRKYIEKLLIFVCIDNFVFRNNIRGGSV